MSSSIHIPPADLRTRLWKSVEAKWKEILGKHVVPISTTPNGTPPGPSHEERPLSVADLKQKNSTTAFKFIHANPWLGTFQGASVLGDIKVKGYVEVSREAFNASQGRDVRDWTHIGGVGEDVVEESNRKSRS